MSQKQQILKALRRGERLTPRDARERFGCDRLASRIHKLKKEGWDIKSLMITLPNGKRVAQYWLPELELF